MIHPVFTLVKELRHKTMFYFSQRAWLTETQISAAKMQKKYHGCERKFYSGKEIAIKFVRLSD